MPLCLCGYPFKSARLHPYHVALDGFDVEGGFHQGLGGGLCWGREGLLGVAGLDVFDIEPLPLDHPLRNLENTVITPHLGYVSNATYRAFYGGMAEDIAAYLAGAPIRVMNAA